MDSENVVWKWILFLCMSEIILNAKESLLPSIGFVSLRNMQEHGVKQSVQVVVIFSVPLTS